VLETFGAAGVAPTYRLVVATPAETTRFVAKTLNDARGIAEPLDRYGELLECQIVGVF
jgi:hypothetical protein